MRAGENSPEDIAQELRKKEENAQTTIADMELRASEAEAEERKLEQDLREAEAATSRAKESEEKGQEIEKKIEGTKG